MEQAISHSHQTTASKTRSRWHKSLEATFGECTLRICGCKSALVLWWSDSSPLTQVPTSVLTQTVTLCWALTQTRIQPVARVICLLAVVVARHVRTFSRLSIVYWHSWSQPGARCRLINRGGCKTKGQWKQQRQKNKADHERFIVRIFLLKEQHKPKKCPYDMRDQFCEIFLLL